MLKKTKFIYGSLLILLSICLIVDLTMKNDNFSFLALAYFIIFITLSVYLIARGVYYKIDTNLYFGILLLISPIVQILIRFNLIKYYYIAIIIFSVLSFASLVIWKYFKDRFHKKLFLLFVGEIFIFLPPFYLTKISIWYLIIMSAIWFILITSVNYIMYKVKQKKVK